MGMFDSSNDPFADVNFSTPTPIIPEVNGDSVSEVLKSFNSQTGVADAAFGLPGGKVPGGTDAGIARVNADISKTGVVGFKDSKGQASFTNVAVNANGTTTRIPTPAAAPTPAIGQPNAIKQTDTALPVASMLAQLRDSKDIGSARATFDALTNATTIELTKLRTDALAFAANKIGIPALEKNLQDTLKTDTESIGYYPGIGDSPVSAKAREELNTARTVAAAEAERYLSTNVSYNSLNNVVKQAGIHFQRLENDATRRATFLDQKEYLNDQRNQNKIDEESRKAEGITAEQLSRIHLLRPADMQLDDGADPKVRAYKIIASVKDKSFQEAINAQGMELPILALKGNSYATALVMAKEEAATGMPQAQIKAGIDKIRGLLGNPQFIAQITSQNSDAKAQLQAKQAAALIDPTKKSHVDDYKLQLAVEYVAKQKTQDFYNDVASWHSIDPMLAAAADASLKTTGNKKFENVLTAYVGDSTGPEAIQKYSQFNVLMQQAAAKHKDSLFGMPDAKLGSATIARLASGRNLFGQWLDNIGKLSAVDGLSYIAPTGATALGQSIHDSALGKALRGEDKKPAIDPATGVPFGE